MRRPLVVGDPWRVQVVSKVYTASDGSDDRLIVWSANEPGYPWPF